MYYFYDHYQNCRFLTWKKNGVVVYLNAKKASASNSTTKGPMAFLPLHAAGQWGFKDIHVAPCPGVELPNTTDGLEMVPFVWESMVLSTPPL